MGAIIKVTQQWYYVSLPAPEHDKYWYTSLMPHAQRN